MRCVLSDSKKVEKHDNHHVSHGCMVRGEMIPRCNGGDGGHRDRKLRLGGGVFVIKAFQNAGDGQVEGVLGRRRSSGVGMSIQNIFLGNTLERDSNRLNLDLTSEPVLAFLHGNSKGEEHISEVGLGQVGSTIIVRVEAAMLGPGVKVTVLDGAIHRRRSNRCPRNVSMTFDFSHGGTIASVHISCRESGNVRSNAVTKLGSERVGVLHQKRACALDG